MTKELSKFTKFNRIRRRFLPRAAEDKSGYTFNTASDSDENNIDPLLPSDEEQARMDMEAYEVEQSNKPASDDGEQGPFARDYPYRGFDKKKGDFTTPKLRRLIAECYESYSSLAKAQMLFAWLNEWLILLPGPLQRKFIFLCPNLIQWECVFKRQTEKANIIFNLTFLDIFGFVLNPDLWAGKSLKNTLFLYYVLLTKRLVVYVEDEGVFYQYSGKRWQITASYDIVSDLVGWLGKLALCSVDKVISLPGDRTLLTQFKYEFSIKTWPFRMGLNLKNGFLTLEEGKYTLIPHHPNHWARFLFNWSVPDEIGTSLSDTQLRFILDVSYENCLNLNLLKQGLFNVLAEGPQNIIWNISGNPRGSKSLITNLIEKGIGDAYRVGYVNSINQFQRESLILNSRVICFPDAAPRSLKPEGITFLKGLTGDDGVPVARKGAEEYSLKSRADIIIASNEDYDSVPAFRDDGLADRLLNFETPSIDNGAVVPGLLRKLGEDLVSNIFLLAMTLDPAVSRECNRASAINAVTGSGAERRFIVFLTTCCVYIENKKINGDKLMDKYKEFLKGVDKNAKPGTNSDFYKKLCNYAGALQPAGIRRLEGRSNKGVVFENIFPGEYGKVPEPHEKIIYCGSPELQEKLCVNPLRIDRLSFRDQSGDLVTGPRLNPTFNQEVGKRISAVKDTNLKNMLQGTKLFLNVKHFMPISFSGTRDIKSLKMADFGETQEVEFQANLQYGLSPDPDLEKFATFTNNALATYLSGKKKAMIAWSGRDPLDAPPLTGLSEEYTYLSEYEFNTNYCINKVTDEEIEALQGLHPDNIKPRVDQPKLVALSVFTPSKRAGPSNPPSPTNVVDVSTQAVRPASKRGRKPLSEEQKAARVAEKGKRGKSKKSEAAFEGPIEPPTTTDASKLDQLFDENQTED